MTVVHKQDPKHDSSDASNSASRTPHESLASPARNGYPKNQASGSGGLRNQMFVLEPSSHESDVVLVMGAAGSGKSTLVSCVSGCAVEAESNIETYTNECKEYAFDYGDRKVILVDTPGFDNGSGSDFDIVSSIVKCVTRLGHVSGVIYLHKITDIRMTGGAYRSIKILRELCGREFFPRIILATSMWNDVSPLALPNARSREKQLEDHFWKSMIGEGAHCLRFDGTQDLGQMLIEPLLSVPQRSLLAVQKELQTMTLPETGVGRLITSELRMLKERRQREAQEDEEALIREGQGMPRQKSSLRDRARQVFNTTAEWLEHIKDMLVLLFH